MHPVAQIKTRKTSWIIFFWGKRLTQQQNCKCGATHKSPAEMCRRFVPAGATGSILTNIDVVHQSIAIQEALPCTGGQTAVKEADNTQR